MDRSKYFETIKAIPTNLRGGVIRTLKEYGVEQDGTIFTLGRRGTRTVVAIGAAKAGYTIMGNQDEIENIDEAIIMDLIEVAKTVTVALA